MPEPFQNFITSLRDTGEEAFELVLRKPINLLGAQGAKARRMFLDLPLRQKVTIYAGVLWVIPIVIVSQYASLYMLSLGLSKTEVGVYPSLMGLVSLVGYFLGGYLSDAWGRKKTLITFDILSWGGYCLCLAMAFNKWWCVAAIFFMATNSGSTAPYVCLLAEGVAKKTRPLVFSVLAIVNMMPSLAFLSLLGGIWVNQHGRLKAGHEMFWLFFAFIALGIALRWRYLPKSPTFEKPSGSWYRIFRDGLNQYRKSLRPFFQKKIPRIMLFSKFLDEWIIWAWSIYSSLYFVDHLGMKDSYLSILGPVSAYPAALVVFLFVPQLKQKQVMKILGVDQLFGVAAFAILLLLSPGGNNILLVCLLSASLWAVGVALYGSVSASVWMNIMREKERSKVVAASYAAIKLGLLTGALGALVYGKISPVVLLYLMIGLRILNFYLLRRASKLLLKTS